MQIAGKEIPCGCEQRKESMSKAGTSEWGIFLLFLVLVAGGALYLRGLN